MPVYMYLCEGGHTFTDLVEAIEKSSEGPACSEAGCGRPSRKVPSPFNMRFVGSGWTSKFYST